MKLIAADGTQYALTQPETTIGRGKQNHIVVADAKASGNHAVVRREGSATLLIDQGSTNGTFVNGSRLTMPHYLRPGDQIMIGDTSLWAQDDNPSAELDGRTHYDPAMAGARRPAPPPPMAVSQSAGMPPGVITAQNQKATVSLISGIVAWALYGLVFCFNNTIGIGVVLLTYGIGSVCLYALACIPMTVWLVAVVTGHMALNEIKMTGQGGRGMAIGGMIAGYAGLGLMVVIALVILVIVLLTGSLAILEGSQY